MSTLDLTGLKGGPSSDRPRQGPSQTAATAAKKAEEALTSDLEGVFGRLADLLAAREDEELSTAFAEDKRVLSQGMVNLTKSVTPLRGPLVLAVHLVEPLLAFGRIAGILIGRLQRKFFVPIEEEQQQQ